MMRKKQKAFTLLEIMLVVSIIALLLAAAIYKLAPTLGFAQSTRISGDLQSIRTALLGYSSLNGFLPSTDQGLEALVNQPQGEPIPTRWRRFMDSVPTDPYGMKYFYRNPGVKNPNSYDLFSAGPDRQPDTADDDWGG